MTAMHSLKTADECNAYIAEHRKLIAERAKEKGLAPPPQRGNACERMKARGLLLIEGGEPTPPRPAWF
mgnify:CR=1 FL=1